MATQLQIRRGTTAQMNAFTGAEGELAVNTSTDTVHVHDGATAGGFALAKADGSNIGTYAGSFTTISASGAITGNVTGNLTGSVLTAAQTNITSVGTLTGLTVEGASSVAQAQNTTLGTNVGLVVGTIGAAGGVGDLNQIGFHYNPSGSIPASIISSILTSTTGYTKSDLLFSTRDVTTNTAPTERLRISSAGTLITKGGAVFNEDGADVDFRVESDGNTHALFVEGNTSNVYMGSSANIEGGRVQVTSSKTLTANIPYGMLGVNDNTAMAQGVGGAINFTGMYNSNGSITSFGSVEGYKTLSNNGNYDGTLVLKARAHGGNQIDKLRLSSTEAVFNEDGLDTDFRVESNSNANAIFVDGSADSVSIGTAGGHKAEFENNGDGVRIVTDNTAHTLGLVSGNSFASGANYTWCKATGGTSGVFDISVNTLGVRLGRNSTSWASLSDSRLKTVTGRYTDAITDVKELDPVKFTWNNDPENSPNVGFLAQSVQGVVPEAVTSDQKIDGDDTKYLSVKYTEVIPLLTAALQEAITKIETLEAKVVALESN